MMQQSSGMKLKYDLLIIKFWRVFFWLKKRFYYPTNEKLAKSNRAKFYDKIWREASQETGASYKKLEYGFAEISRNGKKTIVVDSLTAIDNQITHRILSNKPLCHYLLIEAKVAVPTHLIFNSFNDFSRIEKFLTSAPCDIVIKPAIGTGGGTGVTTNVQTIPQLRKAIAYASIGHMTLIAEHMIPGECYRFLYLDGELLDAVVRRPPSIVGDGKSTINELIKLDTIQRYDKDNVLAFGEIKRDLDFYSTLGSQGLNVRSIPKQGQKVILKTAVNDGSASDTESVKSQVCPALIEEGARASAALGIRLSGVDILTNDLSVSLAESGGVVLEVNTTPGLHLHYLTRNPGTPPTAKILDSLLV